MENKVNKQGKRGKLVPWEIVSMEASYMKERSLAKQNHLEENGDKDKQLVVSAYSRVESQSTDIKRVDDVLDNSAELSVDEFSVLVRMVIFVAVLVVAVIGLRNYVDVNNRQTIKYPYGTYVGAVLFNRPSGDGTLTFNDKSELKGKFVNGQISGVARLTLPDGTYSEGTYVSGKRDGWFTIIKNNSHYIYKQKYSLDKLVGNEEKLVPLKVNQVKITNTNEAGVIIDGLNNRFSKNSIRFINSYVTIFSAFPKEFKGRLQVKYINPDGSLIRNSSDSPLGYSFEKDVEIYPGTNTVNLSGWGNANTSIYMVGRNTIEYYWDGNLIGTVTFTVQ